MCHSPCAQVLELTHNHGTEKDDAFHVHTGNSEPLGFGHIGFLKPAGRGEGLLIAGERRASFSRLPRRRPRGNVQGDGAGVKPLPAPSLPRQSRQRRGGGGMAVTTARGVMVASEREGADGLLLPPLARAELEPIARRGAASCSQPLLLACAGGRPLPQEAAGRRHEQPRIRPRPERRAALRGCAGPPREQHRPHAASCEQATGSSSCSAAPRSQACAPTFEERGPGPGVCSTPEARRFAFVWVSPLPTARRPPRTGCQTDGRRRDAGAACSLFSFS